MAKRLRIGDVLEVPLPDGFGYLQYLGVHPEYGDAVAVRAASVKQRPPVNKSLFGESYVTFYPARAALAQGLVTVMGSLPAQSLPSVFRRPGVRAGGKVETWIIENEAGESLKHALAKDERRIPIAAIWNHEFLIQRIMEAWRPEKEC